MNTSFSINNHWTAQRFLAKTILGSLALAASAQVALRLGPIPFTLQTAFLFCLFYKFGQKATTAMVSLYLLEGACGLPVFAGFTGGLNVLFGPTGGYVWGFIPALFIMDKMTLRTQKSFVLHFASIGLSTVFIFLLGFLQLASFIGFTEAYRWGVYPFLYSEIIKIAIVSFASSLSK